MILPIKDSCGGVKLWISDIKTSFGNKKITKLLRGWVEKGLLEKIGKAKKDSYYRKPGQEVPNGLFSRGVDNKIGKPGLPS